MNFRNTTPKEQTLKSIRILSLVAAVATLTLSLTTADSAEAESLPYGHKDFVPTPEQPVHFRQTYGNYPGATPPLEW